LTGRLLLPVQRPWVWNILLALFVCTFFASVEGTFVGFTDGGTIDGLLVDVFA